MNIPRIEQIAEILNVSIRTAYRYKAKGEQFVLMKLAQVQNKAKGLRKTNIHYAGDFTDNATANVSDNCHNDTLIDDISKINTRIDELTVRIGKLIDESEEMTVRIGKLNDKFDELTVRIGESIDNLIDKTKDLEKTLNKTLFSENTATTDTVYDILLPTDTDNTGKKADSCQYKGGIIGGFDSDSTKTMFQLNQDDSYVTNLDSIETVTRNSKKEKTNKKEKRSRINSKTYNIFPEIKEEILDFFVQRGFSCVEQWVELTREFMEHRCELKKAYTSFKKLSDSRFFPNLIELSQGNIHEAQTLVRNAIAENWLTVYPIKNPHSISGYKSKREQDLERYREGFKRFMSDVDIDGVLNGSITSKADFLYNR